MNAATDIERVVAKIRKLPSLPANIQRINGLMDNRNSTMEAIANEIAKDQTLSAQVLKLINSGLYGLSERVASIRQATVLLGLNIVRNLLSTSWASTLIERSFPGLYDHSVACARTAYVLSRNLGIDEPEQMSTLGLLHDLGKVILAEHLPEQFALVAQHVRENGVRFFDAEMHVMNVTHAELGAWLLTKWNLPPPTVEPVALHHDFDPSSECAMQTALVTVADVLVHAEGFGWSGDNRMPDLPPEVADILQLRPEDLQPLMDGIVDEMSDIPRGTGDPGSCPMTSTS